MSEVINVPDGWELKLSSELCNKIADGTHDTPKPSFFGFKLITSKNLKDNRLDFEDCYLISKEDYTNINKRSQVNQYDILFGMIGTIGNPVIVLDKKIQFSIKNVGLFKFNGNYELSKWFYYYLTSENFNQYLDFILSGSSQKFVSLGMLRTLPILIPKDKKEQEKIAKILSTLDTVIESTQKLIDKEKNIKKGLMTDLLQNGIDKNGKIRTPQTHKYKDSELGLIPEEWKVIKLKECAIIRNSNVDKKTLENEISIKLCNYMDVYVNDEIDFSIEFMNASATEDEINKFLIKEGDVIITKDSESPDDIGIPSYVSENFQDVICGYHLTMIRPKKGCNGKFLSLLLQSEYHKKYFGRLASGSTRFALSLGTISNTLILLPAIEEQKQISKILNSQDEKIEKEEENLAKLKELKKGLMNDLLSGKVRVKIK